MLGLRRLSLLVGLCACGDGPRPVTLAQYQPTIASASWCRLDAGIFGFVPHPQVAPPLLGYGCAATRRDSLPADAPAGSTFAELVIEPGGSIEIPVQLPPVLQGAGCQLDSVLIAHGRRSSDLALEIASAGRTVPIVSYAQLPPPPGDGVVSRTVVSDGSGRRKAIWAPDAPAGENALAAIADPELWPTGAVLRFDGGRRPDGAASIIFEIEKEPEPDPAAKTEGTEGTGTGTETPGGAPSTGTPGGGPPAGTPPSPQPFGPAPPPSPTGGSPSPSTSPSPIGPAPTPIGPAPPPTPTPIGPTPPPTPIGPAPQPWPAPAGGTQAESAEQASPEGDSPSSPATPRQPASLTLIAYRHRIDIAAPDSFSIVLRAREKAFGIGVRSGRESPNPRLSYRAPGAAEPMPTHLVPQVGIVVSRCGRPVEEILRDIHNR